MVFAAMYLIVMVINLLGFVLGLMFLPATVPIRFGANLSVTAVGSPWVYAAFPAGAALIAAGIWTATFLKNERGRRILTLSLAAAGGVLSTLGWVFFALSRSVSLGGKVFPYALVFVLPLAFALILIGAFLFERKPVSPRAKEPVLITERGFRLAGMLLFAAGLVSALVAVLLACLAEDFGYLSAIFFAVSGVAAALVPYLLTKKRLREEARAESNPAKTENDEKGGETLFFLTKGRVQHFLFCPKRGKIGREG